MPQNCCVPEICFWTMRLQADWSEDDSDDNINAQPAADGGGPANVPRDTSDTSMKDAGTTVIKKDSVKIAHIDHAVVSVSR